MKQMARMPILLALALLVAFMLPENRLVGRWGIAGVNEFVDFMQDSTYDVVLPNGDVGERGSYKVIGSTFYIKNAKPVCGDGYWGQYKIDFYGDDSVHFALIQDSCSSRVMDIVGYNPGLRRVKGK